MQQIARVEPPAFVAVVGKPLVRETPEGSVFVSVRAESVTEVDEETYRCWVLDAAAQTLDRLDGLGTTDDSKRAKEFYTTNAETFRKMVYDALVQIRI
jgi:RPA family protein